MTLVDLGTTATSSDRPDSGLPLVAVASGVVVGSSMSASAALPARSPGNRAAWPRRRNRGRAGRSGEGAPGRSERISPSGLALRQDYPGDGTDESKSSHQQRHPEGRRTHRTRLTAIKVMTGWDRLQHPAAAPGETTHRKCPPPRAHAEHPAAAPGETTHQSIRLRVPMQSTRRL